MPDFTTPDNIVYPVPSDPIEPLNAVFQDLAESVQLALTDKIPGTWEPWTPTYGNILIGDGVVTANYAQIGKTVYGNFRLQFGSTTTISTNPEISLPLESEPGCTAVGQMKMVDQDTAVRYRGVANVNGDNFCLHALNTSGTYATETVLGAAVPFTWTIGDILEFYFLYESL
jgi:hypothetical protein